MTPSRLMAGTGYVDRLDCMSIVCVYVMHTQFGRSFLISIMYYVNELHFLHISNFLLIFFFFSNWLFCCCQFYAIVNDETTQWLKMLHVNSVEQSSNTKRSKTKKNNIYINHKKWIIHNENEYISFLRIRWTSEWTTIKLCVCLISESTHIYRLLECEIKRFL